MRSSTATSRQSLEAQAEEYRAQDDRGGRRSQRRADEQVPRGRAADAMRRSAPGCASARSATRSCCACAARPSRTRACRRCSMPSSTSCRRRSRCRPSRASDDDGEPATRKASDDAAVRRARLQDPQRPVRRQPDVLPRLLGRAQLRRHRVRADEGQEGAHRTAAADARQRAQRDQGSARRRHRGGRRPEGCHHRRHAVRPGEGHHAREDGCSRSR